MLSARTGAESGKETAAQILPAARRCIVKFEGARERKQSPAG
jgi:hypothetical protein